MVDILDVGARVAAGASVPKDVPSKLGEARSLLQSDARPFPDPAAGRALEEAHASLRHGRRFEFPPGVKTIEQAREACQREIDRASAALAAGRREDATRAIVAFAMLVATPMEAD